MKQKRRKFSAAIKTKVAIAAIKEQQTLSELAKRFELHPNQISKWKQEFLAKASSVFTGASNKKVTEEPGVPLKDLYAKIGELEIERDFLKKSLARLDRLV